MTDGQSRMNGDVIQLSDDVAAALKANRPVVALESTIIAHGMPYPENLKTAHVLEKTIADAGAVPATIAVLDGLIRVGLDAGALERIAKDSSLPKLSRRDLPVAIATGGSGATTVAATMIGADGAGIRVFATGGIGGVHRGATDSFDVSADLDELASTPVAVVCAGAKAILDLAKTLEYLETKGVPVIGYGTDELPAFYSRESGLAVPLRADSAGAVAEIILAQQRLGYAGGCIVAVPPPADTALPKADMDAVIDQAIGDADAAGIFGKALTPFLLGRIVELTGGRSLVANIALAKNNARVAGQIAVALAALN